MNSIIEKAISGGYEKERYHWDENGSWDWEPVEVMLMKKEFWVSLGKACSWYDNEEMGVLADGTKYSRDGWLVNALRFHELNLTTSFEEAVAWLQKLTSSE